MMFKFLKRIFNRDGSATATAAPHVITTATAPVPRAVEKPVGGGVEVASLSLRAILEKLPPDLRAIINQLPDPSVTIMLPVNTILKQLPAGAVRMSLASLLRQAPQGTFKKVPVEEKQMVDVPLAEVFKCVDATRLGRRSDQRRYDVPEDAAGLFGRNGAGRSVTGAAAAAAESPRGEIAQPAAPPPQSGLVPKPPIEPQKVMRMPGIAPAAASAANGNGNGNGHAAAPAPSLTPKPQAPASSGLNCELVISFVELASGWPEGIRSELSLVPGDTKLVIPAPSVSAGLQKGKVVFPWSQVRLWLRPALSGATAIPEDFELVFPLRIMAPAFVAATGATKRREAAEIDHSLPDFFGPAAGQKATPAPLATGIAPVAESAAPVIPPAGDPVSPASEPVPAPLKFTVVREEPIAIAEAIPPGTPLVALPAPLEEVASSPAEIVARACGLPGVAGAVVALEEGLVIAQSLPPGFSADTFAAFMPQIFGRLEKYTAEMQLGAASEITIQSEHGPCHLARRGKLYFGTLGRAGEQLPENLGNLANQLAALNS